MRTLAEVTVDNEEGKKIKNAEKIFDLQKQFLQSIEDFFDGDEGKLPEVINISLYIDWQTKFKTVRRELIGTFDDPETSKIIKALDSHIKIRTAEIINAIFGISDKFEIHRLREKLNDEMKQLDDFLKKLESYLLQ